MPNGPSLLVPVLLLLALGAVLGWRFWPRSPDAVLDPNATPRTVAARGDLADDEKTTISIFNQTSASAVHITTLAVKHVFSLDLQQIPHGGRGPGSAGTSGATSPPTSTSSKGRTPPA